MQAFVYNDRCGCFQIEHLTACSEIATSHTVNWQKFCQKEDGKYTSDFSEIHELCTTFETVVASIRFTTMQSISELSSIITKASLQSNYKVQTNTSLDALLKSWETSLD